MERTWYAGEEAILQWDQIWRWHTDGQEDPNMMTMCDQETMEAIIASRLIPTKEEEVEPDTLSYKTVMLPVDSTILSTKRAIESAPPSTMPMHADRSPGGKEASTMICRGFRCINIP